MTKVSIKIAIEQINVETIESFNLTSSTGASQGMGLGGFLASLANSGAVTGVGIMSGADEGDDEDEDNAEPSAPSQEPPVTSNVVQQLVPTFNAANLLAFLVSDPRYTARSMKSVAEHFGGDVDVAELGDQLRSAGEIKRLTRRRDGAFLYRITPAGQARLDQLQGSFATQTEPAPTQAEVEASDPSGLGDSVVHDDIIDFLQSDSRYRLRSMDSIKKHFGGMDGIDLDRMVADLIDDDEVVQKRRRSDGKYLYQAV